MYRGRTTLALLPARGGSKRLPDKNILLVDGKPLIARAVEAARAAHCFDRILVSTDDARITEIARNAGAEVPFVRPAELSTDTSPVIETIVHALAYLKEHENFEPDTTVVLQATSPFIEAGDITAALDALSDEMDCCVSVCPISERPEWMFEIEHGRLKQKFPADIFKRSQDMPEVFRLNGAVYARRTAAIIREKRLFDPARCSAVVMPRERSIDIDTPFDMKLAQSLV